MADSGPSCPERDITKRSPDQAPSLVTCDPGAQPGGRNPAHRAAPSNTRVLFASEAFSITRRSDPVQLLLAGEIDMCSIPHLTAALPEAADGSGVLHVDMADVYFCDLAALRTIIGLGQQRDKQHHHPVRPVALHHLPTHIREVLRILSWDTAPGLTIDTAAPSAHGQ